MTRTFLLVAVAVILLVLNVAVYQAIFVRHELIVNVLSVGKGHAVLIQTPAGGTYVVDAGSDASILRALGEELPEWQRSLSGVIETNPAAASAAGLSFLFSRYHAAQVIAPSQLVRGTRINLGSGVWLSIASTSVETRGAATVAIGYGSTVLTLSSSTPIGTFVSDGTTVRTIK